MIKSLVLTKRQIIFVIIVSFLLIFCMFLLRKTINTNVISLLIFIIDIILLYNHNPTIFPKYLSILFTSVFMIIGLFICENTNIYLNELGTFSGYHGSFSLAIIYFLILLLSVIIFDTKKEKKMNNRELGKGGLFTNFICKYIYHIVFLVGLLMFICVIKKPYFILHIDRFQYEKMYLSNILMKMENFFLYLTPLLLFPVIYNDDKFKINDIKKIVYSLLPFILFGFWTGNKFGIFFRIIFLILSPLIVYSTKKNSHVNIEVKNKNKSKIFKSIIIIFVTLLMIISSYYYLFGYNVKDSLTGRVAQQGQLWWKTFELYEDGEMHINELDDEFSALFGNSKNDKSTYNYGVYKIMKVTTTKSIYDHKINTGSRYSAQGIEIAFYYFRYVGIVFHAILRAYFEVMAIHLLIKYCLECRPIETVIISRIIIILHFMFSQGDLYLFFSYDTFISIILLIFLEMLYKKSKKEGKIK